MKTIDKTVCQWCGSKNIEIIDNDNEYSDMIYRYYYVMIVAQCIGSNRASSYGLQLAGRIRERIK